MANYDVAILSTLQRIEQNLAKLNSPLRLQDVWPDLSPADKELALDAKLSTLSLADIARLYETDPTLRAQLEAKKTAEEKKAERTLAGISGAKPAISAGSLFAQT